MDTVKTIAEYFSGEVVAGAFLSLLVSSVFAWFATRGLRNETEKLRKLNILTIRILDEAKLLPEDIEPTKNEAGEYTGGFTSHIKGVAQYRSSALLEHMAIRADDTVHPNRKPKTKTTACDKTKQTFEFPRALVRGNHVLPLPIPAYPFGTATYSVVWYAS